MVQVDDASLVERFLDGDIQAFGTIVERYQRRLYSVAYRMTGNHHDAEDLSQQAFLNAYASLSGFRRGASLYTWLYRIAFNVSVTHRRRRKPVLSVEQARETSGDEPTDDQAGPGERLEQEERRRLVQAAIGRLSDEHRSVLILREIDGCCYETIAEILELPIGTVRSRLHRARLQLKEELKQVLVVED